MANLKGMTILVTRPEPQGKSLCEQIEALHGEAIFFPTIAFAPPPDPEAFHDVIKQLAEQQWVIFNSPQSVKASVDAILARYPVWPTSVKIAAVGAGTAKALMSAGLTVDLQPDQEWSSEGLLNMLPFKDVSGQRIAIVRGLGGREWLDRVLAERGAEVLPLLAYQRLLATSNPLPVQSALASGKIHVAVCTSFEGVNNLKILVGGETWDALKIVPLMVMSERIKSLAEGLGFQTIWVVPQASESAILEMLISQSR